MRENKGNKGSSEMGGSQGYRKLVVWKNARQLRGMIYQITRSFPKTEIRRVAQMRDAARSVKQNIQEGYVRNSIGEYIHFLSIANSSLAELHGDVEDCYEDKLIARDRFEELEELVGKTDYLFHRLISALRKKQKEGTWQTEIADSPLIFHHLP